MLSKVEARRWLVEGKDVEDDPGFWPAVRDKVRQRRSGDDLHPSPRYLVTRRWAAIAALMLLIVAGIWFMEKSGPGVISPATDYPIRFRLNYIRIDGAPAEPVIIQPQDTDLVIVWAAIPPRFPSTR
jgi:hypothetical protein